MNRVNSVLIFTLLAFVKDFSFAYTPIVLYHGMGDTCCQYGSLRSIVKLLNETLPGVEILSLKFGENFLEDFESGFFKNANKQIDEACQQISSNPAFKDGYNSIGFSQGGQFLRAIAQRCPQPPMQNLISLGGQHQGVYGLPNCGTSVEGGFCDYIRKLLHEAAYVSWVQNSLVQAQYWHDPLHEDEYRKYSTFIAEINNENFKNESYVTNLQQLKKLVLVRFNKDTMVNPRESSWFGFYAPGDSEVIQTFDQTRVYKEDLLGLQSMISNGQIDFIETDGNHLQFTMDWFLEYVVKPYLQ